MPDYYTTLYDTAVFGVAVGESTLFQVVQGGDSTHVETFTNSLGSGQIPQDYQFTIQRIHAIVDVNAVAADIQNLPLKSFVEIRLKDTTVFKAPLQLLMSKSAYGGYFAQASAADEAIIGLSGDGFNLPIPIVVDGGVSFKVRVYQGTALANASQYLKIVLEGVLSVPS